MVLILLKIAHKLKYNSKRFLGFDRNSFLLGALSLINNIKKRGRCEVFSTHKPT